MPRNSQSKFNTRQNTGNANNAANNTRSNTQSTTANSGGRSNYSYYKDFGGYNNFMHSYGLKPWDDDDVEEGHAIIEAFRRADMEEEKTRK